VGNGPCSDEARVQRDNAFWIPLFGSAALGAATGNVGLSAFVGSMALHRTGIAFRDKWHPETSVAKKNPHPLPSGSPTPLPKTGNSPNFPIPKKC